MPEREAFPSYFGLHLTALAERAAALRELLPPCALCPRNCRMDRLAGELGVCRIGAEPMVASHFPHFGEENVLTGRRGSGTIFLSGCSLRCVFCQNADISHRLGGRVVSTAELAEMMLDLQRQGCHNLNWVTPTHQVPMLVEALVMARPRGLSLPIVYNCGGYEAVDTLRLLDGLVDIYMPDVKFSRNDVGQQLCGVSDYWDRCQEAVREMHRQVGDLEVGEDGLARRGLLVRHLVMPNDMAGTAEVVRFLVSLSPDTYTNIMPQYRPMHRAGEMAAIARPTTQEEFEAAIRLAIEAGLHRLDQR